MTGTGKLCYTDSWKKLEKRAREGGKASFYTVYMWVGLIRPVTHIFYHWILSLFLLQKPRGNGTTESECCLL